MSEARLKAGLWVRAALRRCAVEGVDAVVAKMGDEDGGAVLVKLYRGPAACEVFAQTRDAQGRPAWMRATGSEPVSEERADAYIARATDIDRDLWVIAVEDRAGRVPFLEGVLG